MVKPDVARQQVPEPVKPGPGPGQGPQPELLTRFHGAVSLDPLRLKRDIDQIADAIVQHLSGQVGGNVEVILEIQAQIPEGASEELIRTITENARVLRFKSYGFESD